MFIKNVLIDRLTIIGNPTSNAKDILNNLVEIHSQYITTNGLYQYNYNVVTGGIVQIDNDNKSIRLDFNPAKYSRNTEKALYPILKLMKNVHLSRVDIAIDIGEVDLLNEYQVKDTRSRKKQTIQGRSGMIETVYFGSRTSDEQIRIYDKAKEQKDETGAKWWRVEVQLRDEKAQKFNSINPFKDIAFTRDKTLEEYSIQTRAMIHYLKTYPQAFNQLSRNAKSKYKQLIIAYDEHLDIDTVTFGEIYEGKRKDLLEQVNSWLSFCDNYEF